MEYQDKRETNTTINPPCLLCGGTPKMHLGYYIECKDCGNKTEWVDTEQAANIVWHRANAKKKRDPSIPTLEEFWEDK